MCGGEQEERADRPSGASCAFPQQNEWWYSISTPNTLHLHNHISHQKHVQYIFIGFKRVHKACINHGIQVTKSMENRKKLKEKNRVKSSGYIRQCHFKGFHLQKRCSINPLTRHTGAELQDRCEIDCRARSSLPPHTSCLIRSSLVIFSHSI